MARARKRTQQLPPLPEFSFPELDDLALEDFPALMPLMSRYERVWSTVRGEEVDRPPVCFWHHFNPGGSGRNLAEDTMMFFNEEFELDIAKLMPDIEYPFPPGSIKTPGDWLKIEPLDPVRSRFLYERAAAVRQLRALVGIEMPIVVTVFNPLRELINSAESLELFIQHAHESPAMIHEVLSVVTDNIKTHNRMVLEAGADGLFFALHGCTRTMLTEEMYREFGRPYDLMALQGTQGSWLNILHIHGDKDLMIDLVLDYPVSVLSWSDRIAGPTLREMRAKTSKTLMGGWNESGAITIGDKGKIRSEAQDAIKQTAGRKLILAPGCSVPDDIDHHHLEVARDIVDGLAK